MNADLILVLLTGLFIRLAVPFTVTVLVVLMLRRMDARWQAEAERDRILLEEGDVPCWKEQGLSADEVKLKAAKGEKPCWQMYRLTNGNLREACLDCDVFLSAPAPSHITSHL